MIGMEFAFADQAWQQALNLIERQGNLVRTERNQLIKEVRNLVLEVHDPLSCYPIKDSGWNFPALKEYAESLCNFSYELKGFDYNYCERMGRQVYYITEMLRKYPTTNHATIFLWLPEKDLETDLHKPCQIVADYKLREDKLHAVHFFRSHDIQDAWPVNLYGLATLQKQIANDLEVRAGTITTFSTSAHYYVER